MQTINAVCFLLMPQLKLLKFYLANGHSVLCEGMSRDYTGRPFDHVMVARVRQEKCVENTISQTVNFPTLSGFSRAASHNNNMVLVC